MSRQKQKQQEKPQLSDQEPKSSSLVKMVNAGGKVADVHPSEVDNFKSGGYEVK